MPIPLPATAVELGRLSPAAFRRFLAAAGIRRFFLIWDEEAGGVRASHPELAPLARLLAADRRDFDRHEGIFVQVAPDTGVLQGAFIHRTCRGQAAGGVRFWRYDTVEEFLAAAGVDADRWENSIYNLSLAILAEAARRGEPPVRVALRLAESRSREPHPIWGHRGAAIIRALTRPGAWAGPGRS